MSYERNVQKYEWRRSNNILVLRASCSCRTCLLIPRFRLSSILLDQGGTEPRELKFSIAESQATREVKGERMVMCINTA